MPLQNLSQLVANPRLSSCLTPNNPAFAAFARTRLTLGMNALQSENQRRDCALRRLRSDQLCRQIPGECVSRRPGQSHECSVAASIQPAFSCAPPGRECAALFSATWKDVWPPAKLSYLPAPTLSE